MERAIPVAGHEGNTGTPMQVVRAASRAPIEVTRTPKGHRWTPQGSTERPIETTRAQIGSLGNNGGHTRGANGGHKVTNGDHTRATGTPIEGTRGTRRTAKAAKWTPADTKRVT